MKNIIISVVIITLFLGGVVVYFTAQNQNSNQIGSNSTSSSSSFSSESVNTSQSASTSNNTEQANQPSAKPGVFTAYTQDELKRAENGNVVLFFNASWCPTCQSTVRDLNSKKDQIPSDLAILSLDYDKETSLRQKYGVTMQHTFVKVDKDGNSIKKITGLNNLQAISDFAK